MRCRNKSSVIWIILLHFQYFDDNSEPLQNPKILFSTRGKQQLSQTKFSIAFLFHDNLERNKTSVKKPEKLKNDGGKGIQQSIHKEPGFDS